MIKKNHSESYYVSVKPINMAFYLRMANWRCRLLHLYRVENTFLCFYLRLKGQQWYCCGDLTKPHTRSDDYCELLVPVTPFSLVSDWYFKMFTLQNKAMFSCVYFSGKCYFSTSVEFVSLSIVQKQYEKLETLLLNMYVLFKDKI